MSVATSSACVTVRFDDDLRDVHVQHGPAVADVECGTRTIPTGHNDRELAAQMLRRLVHPSGELNPRAHPVGNWHGAQVDGLHDDRQIVGDAPQGCNNRCPSGTMRMTDPPASVPCRSTSPSRSAVRTCSDGDTWTTVRARSALEGTVASVAVAPWVSS